MCEDCRTLKGEFGRVEPDFGKCACNRTAEHSGDCVSFLRDSSVRWDNNPKPVDKPLAFGVASYDASSGAVVHVGSMSYIAASDIRAGDAVCLESDRTVRSLVELKPKHPINLVGLDDAGSFTGSRGGW